MEHLTWEESMRRGRVAMEAWLKEELQPVLEEELRIAEKREQGEE
jgi:hypothetical protein